MISEYQITLIAQENIPIVFPRVQARLAKALEYGFGEIDLDELSRMLEQGAAQLWVGATPKPELKMIGVTRILAYPCVKRLSFDLLEGEDLNGFMHYLDVLENWARQFGATETEARVRPGLRKKLTAIGFIKAYEVVLRPIAEELH